MLSSVIPLIVLAVGQAPAPRFTIETPGLGHHSSRLIALDLTGALEVEDAAGRHKIPRFIEIRQDGRKLPPFLTRNFVSLINGDRLPFDAGAAPKLVGSKLRVRFAEPLAGDPAQAVDLFLPNVVLLFWSLPDGVDDAERFFAQLQEEVRKRDVVFLKNGDRIEGTITALDAKIGCTLTAGTRKVQTPPAKLAGIAFNTDRQARLRTKKAYSRAVLDGGGRVNFLELRFEEKARRWVGKAQFGATLEFAEPSLLGLDVRQDRAVDLSELTPARYEYRPFLGAAWPLVKDAAATGQPLRLAGSTFEKGLGTHAACQVVYLLDGKYQRFDAVVGIDESARRGRAKVSIDLDGKRIDLNDGKELTHQTAPIRVRLDVSKVRTLTLIVDFGSLGDVQARVNWANARLIKKDADPKK